MKADTYREIQEHIAHAMREMEKVEALLEEAKAGVTADSASKLRGRIYDLSIRVERRYGK